MLVEGLQDSFFLFIFSILIVCDVIAEGNDAWFQSKCKQTDKQSFLRISLVQAPNKHEGGGGQQKNKI